MNSSLARPWTQHYDPGVAGLYNAEDLTIPQLLERTLARHADATALIYMNRRYTYRELADEVRRMATALADLGVERGSRVAIQLPNLPQTVISYYAVLSLGAVAVMTNPMYVAREIEHQWNDADCRVAIVADFLYEQRIRSIRERLPVRHYIVAGIAEYLEFPLNLLAPIKLRWSNPPLVARRRYVGEVHRFRDLVRGAQKVAPEVPRVPDDVAMIQYTGGTTGVSKGALLTHRNLTANVQQIRSWFTSLRDGEEVWLGSLPFFHIFGVTVAMNFPLSVGAALVLMPDPRDIAGVVRSIERQRVTVFPGVPAQFNAINQYAGIDRADLTSLRACVSGSAPLADAVLARFEELTGSKMVEGFGLTEASPVTHCTPLLGARKVGSIGLPLPGTDARIVDLKDSTRTLPPGKEGELVIRGPQVMSGYWQRPDDTEEAIRDGWLHTGDIAVSDEEGFFRIAGRKKDMIIAGGYNIYPDEIDQVLMSHPDVSESATIGIPDARRGETVMSFIVRLPGKKLSASEVVAFARERLAAYKVPRVIEFREDLPRTTVMKVLRRELRDEVLLRSESGQ